MWKQRQSFLWRVIGVIAVTAGVLATTTFSRTDATDAAETDTTLANLCQNRSGTLSGPNLITELDNGTFGSESGAANASPANYPYDPIAGYTYRQYAVNNLGAGVYSLIANSNITQSVWGTGYTDLTDPDEGPTGRVLMVNGSPTQALFMTQDLTGLLPHTNYEYSMWAANLINADPIYNANLALSLDGQELYNSGQLTRYPTDTWQRIGFVFNTGSKTSATVTVTLKNPSASGRDFGLDNIRLRNCTLPSGNVTGTAYIDGTENDKREPFEVTLPNVKVQLVDSLGDTDTANDIIVVDEATTDADGKYEFRNVPTSQNYFIKVLDGKSVIPAGVSGLGTANNVLVRLQSAGQSIADVDFGFDEIDNDKDADGNPNITDPNPDAATAVDDATTTLPGRPVTLDLLANDDFSPGPPTSLKATGGSAQGTSVLDPLSGNLTYTPAASEVAGAVTVDYEVCHTPTSVCANAVATININRDTDGDGIPDDVDPDDDNDGNPDTTDPNPGFPLAQDDSDTTTPNTPVTIDVLANDDFVPGGGTSLTRTGGTAAGTAVLDPISGTLVYTPTSNERDTAVTVDYRACGIASTPNGCDDATVTIDIRTDTDGDGIPDDIDPDDDNDGNPDTTDPNPLAATVAPDSVTQKRSETSTTDVLANDDFLPSADLSMTRTGGTAAGTVTFDPLNGAATYTPGSSERDAVTVDYEICYLPTGVCASTTHTIIISSNGVITGVVYLDRNRDGSPHNDEQLEGVVIELLDANGALTASATTQSPYAFTDLDDGRYTVRVVSSSLPEGIYAVTPESSEVVSIGETATKNFGYVYPLITGTARTFDGQTIPRQTVEITDGAGNVHEAITQGDGTYRVEGSSERPLIPGRVELDSEIDSVYVGGSTTLEGPTPLIFDLQGPASATSNGGGAGSGSNGGESGDGESGGAGSGGGTMTPIVLAFTGLGHWYLLLIALAMIEVGLITLRTLRRNP